jgi:L-alanine-DL-glutamate epimerase-like enolase superfamily enzyme
LKITNIKVRRVETELSPPFNAAWDPDPRRSFEATLVAVETDESVTGIGSGDTMDGFASYEHLFVGQDPTRISHHVRVLETISFHAGRYWPLEVALWDLYGKVCGQPVAKLFGGATDRVPAYASCGELKHPAERAESALRMREEGFRALKLRVDPVDPARLEEGIATVAAVREAVGGSMEIMVDLNQWWRMAGDVRPGLDPTAARNIARRLGELGVFWLEEPLPGADVRGMADLRKAGGPRIAGGEMARTVPELLRCLEADALDVYQPDVVLAVGMLRARTLGELAMAYNRNFTPHTWTNGLGVLANLHVTAGIGGGPYLEFPYDPPGWTPERRDFMLAEPVNVESDGCLRVPDAPGLGAELSEEAHRALR